jgi:hypothetical protein
MFQIFPIVEGKWIPKVLFPWINWVRDELSCNQKNSNLEPKTNETINWNQDDSISRYNQNLMVNDLRYIVSLWYVRAPILDQKPSSMSMNIFLLFLR